ncbi:hypothetical protein EDD16DRAFT_1703282 [Pisolithus croceorrhizus]|nr:hypothetical protein EDD16DRAFT_1703282 [Pisolithus croceorrhizus]
MLSLLKRLLLPTHVTKSDGSPRVLRHGATESMGASLPLLPRKRIDYDAFIFQVFRRLQERNGIRRPPPYLVPILHFGSIFDNIRARFSNIQERIEDIEDPLDRSNSKTMPTVEDDFGAFQSEFDDDEFENLLSVMGTQLDVALAVEESLTTARAASLRDVPQAPDDQIEQRFSDPFLPHRFDELADPEVDQTPTPDPPSSTRRAPTPRFSTVVNFRSRETLAVDASDEENTAASSLRLRLYHLLRDDSSDNELAR